MEVPLPPDSPQQYEEGKKRRSPNYSSVDLSEVEWEDRDDVVSGLRPVVWQVHCTRSRACRRPREPVGGTRPPEGHGGHGSCTCLQLYDSPPCLLCAVCWRRPLCGLVPPHSRSTLLLLRAGLGPAALGDPGLTLLGSRRLCPLQSGPEPACEHVPGAACACSEQPRAPQRPSSRPVGHPSSQAAERLHLSAHRQASGTAAKLSSCPWLSPASLLAPSPVNQICQMPLPVCESRRAVLD